MEIIDKCKFLLADISELKTAVLIHELPIFTDKIHNEENIKLIGSDQDYFFKMRNKITTDQQLVESFFKDSKLRIFEEKFEVEPIYDLEGVDVIMPEESDNKTIIEESLSRDEARELGRLRNEKAKWHDSIKASVLIGIFCMEKEKEHSEITRYMLGDKLFELGFSELPNTTVEKIWKAIPEKYRKKAGRPPENNN